MSPCCFPSTLARMKVTLVRVHSPHPALLLPRAPRSGTQSACYGSTQPSVLRRHTSSPTPHSLSSTWSSKPTLSVLLLGTPGETHTTSLGWSCNTERTGLLRLGALFSGRSSPRGLAAWVLPRVHWPLKYKGRSPARHHLWLVVN